MYLFLCVYMRLEVAYYYLKWHDPLASVTKVMNLFQP